MGVAYHFAVARPEMQRIKKFYDKYDVEFEAEEARDEALRLEKLKELTEEKE
jgi:uncharacterized membrane protein (DUF106 family)